MRTRKPLSVELGPGMFHPYSSIASHNRCSHTLCTGIMNSIFDGIQRPLEVLYLSLYFFKLLFLILSLN